MREIRIPIAIPILKYPHEICLGCRSVRKTARVWSRCWIGCHVCPSPTRQLGSSIAPSLYKRVKFMRCIKNSRLVRKLYFSNPH